MPSLETIMCLTWSAALRLSRIERNPSIVLSRPTGSLLSCRSRHCSRYSLHLLIERAVGLETRVAVRLKPGPDIVLQLDPDQIEQLVINLLRNAAEAALARFPDAPSNSEVPK